MYIVVVVKTEDPCGIMVSHNGNYDSRYSVFCTDDLSVVKQHLDRGNKVFKFPELVEITGATIQLEEKE